MESIRIALAQTRWTGDRASLMNTYRDLVRESAQKGAEIVCLPELTLSPYFPGKPDESGFQWAEPLQGGASDRFFSEIASTNRVTIVGSTFERTGDGHYYDTATIHNAEGRLIHFTRKVHIPSGEGYHENAFFEGGAEYPVHDLGKIRIAVPTCYDQWFPELARIYALSGAEFIFYPTAIGSEPADPELDTMESWQTVMRGHAIANGLYVAAANRTGLENSVRFYGSSFVCDPTGRILAQAGRNTTEVIVADLDAYTLEHWRELFPLLYQRRPQTYGKLARSFGQELPTRRENLRASRPCSKPSE